ncbi:hypothetical protein [Vampirovibrio sp.]|uniref:hypothetical protein n=1 Tax=Vampirovibrio sp. TaxID=2717857 RepID=UPI0035932E0F
MPPITTKLLPLPGNLVYLAEVAVLTRLATGVMRVLENRPSKQSDPHISEAQKKQSMAERFFVEIFGTMGYMLCLHLGQDLVDKLADRWDRRPELHFLNQKENLFKGLEHNAEFQSGKSTLENLKIANLKITIDDLDQRLRESAEDVFGKYSPTGKERPNHMVYNTLYEHALPGTGSTGKANLVTVKNRLRDKLVAGRSDLVKGPQLAEMDEALSKIVNEVKPLKDFAMKNNKLAVLGIAIGVASSAIVGGTLTQWMNDRVIAPGAKKFFAKKEQQKLAKNAILPIPEAPLQTAPKSFSLLSPSPGLPVGPAHLGVIPPPVYLPNPKMQGGASGFAMSVFPPPVHSGGYPFPKPGGGL